MDCLRRLRRSLRRGCLCHPGTEVAGNFPANHGRHPPRLGGDHAFLVDRISDQHRRCLFWLIKPEG